MRLSNNDYYQLSDIIIAILQKLREAQHTKY